MSETTDKVMRKIAAMEADGWDMSDFRTALAAEVKRREEAERDLADAMGFVKSLMILICGNEYVTNHPKEEWVTWIQGVYRDFGPHLTKEIAALRKQVEKLTREKESALFVEAEWNPQQVAKEIDVPFGASIRKAILPWVLEAKKRIANP